MIVRNAIRKVAWGLAGALAAFGPHAAAHAAQVPGPLVETDWLARHAREVVVMDVRANPRTFTAEPFVVQDSKTGKVQLLRVGGHIPGAVLVEFGKARTDRRIGGRTVQKMLPERADFERLMQEAGVKRDSAIVLVTEGQTSADVTIAARMYWPLKYFGHDNVAILNGGMAAWIAERRPLSLEPLKPAPGDWRATTARREILATSEDVAEAVKNDSAQLMDNRDLAQYLGTAKRDYVYAQGHIPGAKVFPHELIAAQDGVAKFLPREDLRQLAEALRVQADRRTIAYCNSGHLAAGGWFVLSELLGNRDVKLYDGSMHQWTLERRAVTTMKIE